MNKKCVRIMKNLVTIGFSENLDKAILACANIASSTEDVFTLDVLNCDLNVEHSFEWSVPCGLRKCVLVPEEELTEEECEELFIGDETEEDFSEEEIIDEFEL